MKPIDQMTPDELHALADTLDAMADKAPDVTDELKLHRRPCPVCNALLEFTGRTQLRMADGRPQEFHTYVCGAETPHGYFVATVDGSWDVAGVDVSEDESVADAVGRQPDDAEVTRDRLLMHLDFEGRDNIQMTADVERLDAIVRGWTPIQRKQSDLWSVALHFRASDNDDVPVPEQPRHVFDALCEVSPRYARIHADHGPSKAMAPLFIGEDSATDLPGGR